MLQLTHRMIESIVRMVTGPRKGVLESFIHLSKSTAAMTTSSDIYLYGMLHVSSGTLAA